MALVTPTIPINTAARSELFITAQSPSSFWPTAPIFSIHGSSNRKLSAVSRLAEAFAAVPCAVAAVSAVGAAETEGGAYAGNISAGGLSAAAAVGRNTRWEVEELAGEEFIHG